MDTASLRLAMFSLVDGVRVHHVYCHHNTNVSNSKRKILPYKMSMSIEMSE